MFTRSQIRRASRLASRRGRCVVGALLLLAGCSRPAPQSAGANGLRLVSTAPNLTECVFAVGAGDTLVGRTESCNFPPAARGVPVVGGFGTPWLEPLLAARPTHVLETVLADPDLCRRLDTLRIPVVHVACSRLDEVPAALRQIGALTGHRTEGDRAADALGSGIAAARAETARSPRHPRVLLLLAADAPITAGSQTFMSELLELAGAVNIGGTGGTAYYRFSLEWLLQQNPDIILCCFETPPGDPAAQFAHQTGWKALDAVRNHRVYAVADLDTVCRPGPRLLQGLAELKRILDNDARHTGGS
jgi:iron complex transport system substrate-binding protein